MAEVNPSDVLNPSLYGFITRNASGKITPEVMESFIIANSTMLSLAASKESAINKYPQHKRAIEYFVQSDPTGGSLKYLDWEIKMLETHQALEREIANIVSLFHKYSQQLDQKDLYQYQPNDFIDLKDKLYEIKVRAETKKEQRKKVYSPIDSEEIACGHKVIYDSPNFRCLQITNRAAAAHYGIETKWCITSQETAGFEDYNKNNVIVFYVFNKRLTKADPNYKLAYVYSRDHNNNITEKKIVNSRDITLYGINEDFPQFAIGDDKNVFTDESLNVELSKIQEKMTETAKLYPKSMMAKFFSGELSVSKMFEMFDSEKNERIKTMLAAHLARNGGYGDPDLEKYLEEH